MHLDNDARHPRTQAAAQPLKLICYFSTLYSCLYHRQRLRHDIMRRFWTLQIAFTFTIRNSGTSQLFASQTVVFTLHFSGLQKKDVNVRHVLYTTAFYFSGSFSSYFLHSLFSFFFQAYRALAPAFHLQQQEEGDSRATDDQGAEQILGTDSSRAGGEEDGVTWEDPSRCILVKGLGTAFFRICRLGCFLGLGTICWMGRGLTGQRVA